MLSEGKTKVIGLIGKKTCGKTSTAQLLSSILHLEHGVKVEIISFSGFLKAGIQALFGVSFEEMTNPKWKETVLPYWKVTPRELLQKFGTEVLRDYVPKIIPNLSLDVPDELEMKGKMSISTKMAFLKIKEAFSQDKIVVLDDVRFKDEANLISQLGGMFIRLNRGSLAVDTQDKIETKIKSRKRKRGVSKRNRKKRDDFSLHQSEIEQDSLPCDFTLTNDGNLDDLKKLLQHFVSNNINDPTFSCLTVGNASISKVRDRNCSHECIPIEHEIRLETPNLSTTSTRVNS